MLEQAQQKLQQVRRKIDRQLDAVGGQSVLGTALATRLRCCANRRARCAPITWGTSDSSCTSESFPACVLLGRGCNLGAAGQGWRAHAVFLGPSARYAQVRPPVPPSQRLVLGDGVHLFDPLAPHHEVLAREGTASRSKGE